MQIHVQRGEEDLGKFTPEEVTKQLVKGHLKESDLGWHEGMETWIPLSQLCEQLETGPKKPPKENPDEKSLPAWARAATSARSFWVRERWARSGWPMIRNWNVQSL